MKRILVTGSSQGLGRAAAETLLGQGHEVLVHARNSERAAALAPLAQRGARILVADLSNRQDVLRLAAQLADCEPADAVIHNAGAYTGRDIMPVNVIAPYLLTALLPPPKRLVYVSSGSHFDGSAPRLERTDWSGQATGSYADSKLYLTTLMAAISRLWPDVLSNAVNPGWVPTRMGGPHASDDFTLGHRTQEWLAASQDPQAMISGGYWYHQALEQPHETVHDVGFQDRLLEQLAAETGVGLDSRP